MSELYIGLMSGTSGDGIDAVLVDFSNGIKILSTHYQPYTDALREKIFALCQPGQNEIQRLGELDVLLGQQFAQASMQVLKNTTISANMILAIGSHGHTIRHCPKEKFPFTLQIGDPNIIAAQTGITTVADFRRKDMALGGQGAPLVPAFHDVIFSSDKTDRVILNIGGIANVTFLPKDKSQLIGFDTGPGNTLLDAWIYKHKNEWQDKMGNWARSGKIHEGLLKRLLQDRYFHLTPPKSTGREYFNLAWLKTHLDEFVNIDPTSVQTTLTELTALSIIEAIKPLMPQGEILVCGGGIHNEFLLSRLKQVGSHYQLHSTERYGLHPDWVEATAFAWLAKQTLNKQAGNAPLVTGASAKTILGGVYQTSN